MTEYVDTLDQFLSNVDTELDRQTKDAPFGPETVLTKIKVLFPDTYRQMEKEGVLQLLENPEGLRTYLHEFFKKHRESNLPEHVEPRASKVSPGEVAKRVETYETATREADRALHGREEHIRELRAAYVKRVAQNFIDQTRAYYQREAKGASKSVAAQIAKAQRAAADIPDRIETHQTETYIRQVEEDLPQFPEKPAIRTRIEVQAKDLNVQYTEAVRQHKTAKEAVVEAKKRFFASDNPTTRPDVLLTQAVELSETAPYSATDVARVAELQARAVEFQELDASAVSLGGHGFFQTIADPTNPGELKRASAADRVFDSLKPEQKMAVVRDIIDRSLARFEGPVAKATEAVGGKVAASQITTNAIRQAILTGDTARGASAASSVGGVAEGLFRSFGGIPPQTMQLIGQSKTLEWLNTQSFYAFLMVEKLKTSLGGAGKFVLREGAEAVAKKVGGLGVKKLIGGTLGSVFGGPVGAVVGSFVTDVVIGKTLEWGGKLLAGAGYVLSGGVFTSILQGKPASPTDALFLFPLLIIILIPLLFIFPWVLNIPQFSDDVRRTALLESMGGEEEGPGTPTCLDMSITAAPVGSGVIPTDIQYTVNVNPTCEGSLVINEASVSFFSFGNTSSATIPPKTITAAQLSGGSFSFVVPMGPQFNNAVISATFSLNANVGAQTGISGSTTTSTIIGSPSSSCFVFGGAGVDDAYKTTPASSSWGDRSGIFAAIGQLQRSPEFIIQLCKAGDPNGPDIPITLYRINAKFGGGSAFGANTIFIYDGGSKGMSAVYTLAHEAGHIINHRTGLFSEYNQLALYAREGPILSYPNCYSEGEDFAETLGVYVIWRSYSFLAHGALGCGRPSTPAGYINYPERYPLHYRFAKSVFGIEY